MKWSETATFLLWRNTCTTSTIYNQYERRFTLGLYRRGLTCSSCRAAVIQFKGARWNLTKCPCWSGFVLFNQIGFTIDIISFVCHCKIVRSVLVYPFSTSNNVGWFNLVPRWWFCTQGKLCEITPEIWAVHPIFLLNKKNMKRLKVNSY